MAKVEFFDSTEENILALTPVDPQWKEFGLYWPRNKDYFYRIVNGVLVAIGKTASESVSSGEGVGIGIKLNGKVIGGVKSTINASETLEIPEDWEYNCYNFAVWGNVTNFGQINIMQ